MQIFAHRGCHNASCRENTLAAFQLAVDTGVTGIETDVRLDANGVPILFHDRCLPNGRPIASLNRRQLSEAAGYPVPTLSEALDQAWDVTWDLEMKNPEALDAAMPILRLRAKTRNLYITSFIHTLVLRAADSLHLEGGLLLAHAPTDADSLGAPTAYVRTLVWDFETVTAELISHVAMRGFRSMVYGVVTRDEHNQAASWGVAAVITDFPDYAMPWKSSGRF